MPSSGAIFLNILLGALVLVPVLLAFVVKAEIEKIDRMLSELKPDRSGSQSPPAPADAGGGATAAPPEPEPAQPPAAEATPQTNPQSAEIPFAPEPPKAGANLPTGLITTVAINVSGIIIRGLLSGMVRRNRKRDSSTPTES